MANHALDPLSADEIRRVTAVLQRDKGFGPGWAMAFVEAVEPTRRQLREGAPVDRRAHAVVWQRPEGTAYRALISLADDPAGDAISSWEQLEGVQPNMTDTDWEVTDQVLRGHPDLLAALAERGIESDDDVLFDMWAFGGHLIPERYAGKRVGWVDLWVRGSENGNPYAHPIPGITPILDLNAGELLEIEVHGTSGAHGPSLPTVFAPVMGEYLPRLVAEKVDGFEVRTDRSTLDIVQPDGAGFTVEGQELGWQRWRMRVGFNYREGLTLHQVTYDGRSVADRLSFAEMVVPYRDAGSQHFRRTAYDIGEWGLGNMTTSLELGCDCLGEIVYLDAVLADSKGQPKEIRNAVCLHEEDSGVLWKHVDYRAGAEVRRSRRFVVSFHTTVANYEYLVYWRFYEDGNIECEVRATGIMVTTPYDASAGAPAGPVVDQGTYAPIHQHFIVARLDLAVDAEDGSGNTVVMTETVQPPVGPANPDGLALQATSTPLRTEADGKQDFSWETQRAWKVTNPNKQGGLGQAPAYKLVPGAAIPSMLAPDSPVLERARVLEHALWVTPYAPDERWPCGEFVTQSTTDTGLPVWTRADRSIENTDVVLWYTFGIHHVPRPEDWPVMPVDIVSFWLKPVGFFDRNPALDVAPSEGSGDHCHHH
ncbi:primary-amine oxidase [Nocardioides sp. Kera G14]|uniref:primary-amine oxidase n=1 Tax=Nocardioides sp. Kera G14 TaxID=2884264 RepID=UPI001D120B49|nr:primary-amine oxidase [Nocardioides sp. Kera G14]UDY24560.1 primary-amine oxidase [Nocardioides sp. Kera G14]